MAGVMDELNELVRQDATIKTRIKLAKNLIAMDKMTLEEISIACELPLEKVRELAANVPIQPKEPN